jgi:uncharacterized protein YoxC
MNTQDHEKLFDEICNKLNELSHREDSLAPQSQKIEKMQSQIKRFHEDLQGAHDELRGKIQSLENMQFSQGDINTQLRQLTEQLHSERVINTKLNSDLAKSLELSLQLQLEVQSVKARTTQVQNEEKRFSQTLQEKLKSAGRDLELANALKEETIAELGKAKLNFQTEQVRWEQERGALIKQTEHMQSQKDELLKANQDLLESLARKEEELEKHTHQIEELSQALNSIEATAQDQASALKNLMEVAESKIVEIKMALDKKAIEGEDYYGHLQQALTQTSLLRQENSQLKEYINKVSVYFQAQATSQNLTQNPSQNLSQNSTLTHNITTPAANLSPAHG